MHKRSRSCENFSLSMSVSATPATLDGKRFASSGDRFTTARTQSSEQGSKTAFENESASRAAGRVSGHRSLVFGRGLSQREFRTKSFSGHAAYVTNPAFRKTFNVAARVI